jgi:hypothetical protein
MGFNSIFDTLLQVVPRSTRTFVRQPQCRALAALSQVTFEIFLFMF